MTADGNYSLLPDPSPEEAAAAIAAIERFLADTASPVGESTKVISGWLRAALNEGVGSSDRESIW